MLSVVLTLIFVLTESAAYGLGSRHGFAAYAMSASRKCGRSCLFMGIPKSDFQDSTIRKTDKVSDSPLLLNKDTTSFSPLFGFDVIAGKHVLVVGGTGRVGGSVVLQLLSHGARVTVAGTSRNTFDKKRKQWEKLVSVSPDLRLQFAVLNRDNLDSVLSVLQSSQADTSSDKPKFDIVVHTAGPFQKRTSMPNFILQTAIAAKIPYIDVCDDYCTAMASRHRYHKAAIDASVPCIVSTGCWPGVSNIMALQLLHCHQQQTQRLQLGSGADKEMAVDFSFFTAGSGGAGVTLLVATFLILSEQALLFMHGRRKTVPPMKEFVNINFGRVIGRKAVSDMNLLEAASIHENLQIPSIRCRFGTAPAFWNTLLGFMANLLPSDVLANETVMRKLSTFSMPIVRAVDFVAGASNAMKCDLSVTDTISHITTKYSATYGHADLQPSVGECITAFVCAVLSSRSNDKGAVDTDKTVVGSPGVWFPEQFVSPGKAAQSLLYLASVGAHTTTVEVTGNSNAPLVTSEQVWGRM
jgi:saccharopine dehydrogenase-like NADP-dependent oxidoreductase